MKYCKDSEKHVVRVYGYASGTICTVFIEDNGIGFEFEEEYSDRIFRPFQQLMAEVNMRAPVWGLPYAEKLLNITEAALPPKVRLGRGRLLSSNYLLSREGLISGEPLRFHYHSYG
jgi:light-regulated signal transduction histidine kinase (bacteriophytochrome)